MNDKNISEKLRALATGNNRPVTERLREIFDDIEQALSHRARRIVIYETLKDGGVTLKEGGGDITFKSFELAISRIREERNKLNIHIPQAEESPNTPPDVQQISIKDDEVELSKPPGITESEWSDRKIKARAAKRKKT